MEQVQREVNLLTDHVSYFVWPSNKHCKQEGFRASIMLFEGGGENFNFSQPDCNDEYTFSVLSAVKDGIKSYTGPSSIELAVTYENGGLRMCIKMLLDGDLVKMLSNLMSGPKIAVQGTFLNENLPFSVSGMKVGTYISTHNFEGSSKILQHLEGYTAVYRYPCTCSFFLEWADVKMRTVREPCAALEILYSEKFFTDCCIITAEETEVKCHRNILAANSDVIRAMLTNDMQESQTNRIEMTDISEEVVNLLLAYIYGRAINTREMKVEIAFDLLRTAHKYNITSMEEHMVVTLFNRPNNSFNMNIVLDLYFFTMSVDELNLLYDKMLNILKCNPRKLLASSVYKELLKESPEEASKLALKLLELVIGEPSTRALPSV